MKWIHHKKDLMIVAKTKTDAFLITLPMGLFESHRILRLLPKKRIVVEGTYHGQPAIAKIFFTKASRAVAREKEGEALLTQSRIPHADILYAGETTMPGVLIVIYKSLFPAESVRSIWVGEEAHALRALLVDMQACFARLHQVGAYHNDPHPDNFLRQLHRLAMVDCAAVRKMKSQKPLSLKKSLNQLARFYAQLPVRHHSLIKTVLPHYFHTRQLEETPAADKLFWRYFKKYHFARMQQAMRHFDRAGTHIFSKRTLGICLLAKRQCETSDWKVFFKNIDQAIAAGEILKAGNTCTVAKVMVAGQPYAVKRYNIKNLAQRVRRWFKESRARHSWHFAHVLEHLRIETPEPVAMIERRFLGFRGRSYFVMRYVEPMTLKQFFETDCDWQTGQREQVVDCMVSLIEQFYEAHLIHGDFKASNFLRMNEKIGVLDLDAMKIIKRTGAFNKAFRAQIKRFIKNWTANPWALQAFQARLKPFLENH